jgi:hypothetical protein
MPQNLVKIIYLENVIDPKKGPVNKVA